MGGHAIDWSTTWSWIDGSWHEGNVPLYGVRTHAAWLGSTVFDGARAFEGVTPDLDLHCARVNDSARALGLAPTMTVEEMLAIAREGLARFDPQAALYIRPLYWAEAGGYFSVPPLPESTRFCMSLFEVPMPEPQGFSIMLSSFRRPTLDSAPVNAKASCLYPNNGLALLEAKEKGFDNTVLCDALGNVAELATANLFMVKDGVVRTPAPNGTFLNGITRQRIIFLLRADGFTVEETTLRWRDFQEADEIFSTGNYAKVMPADRIEDRRIPVGPVATRARELYWQFAKGA
ncbi:MAG TPA: branched-chain amino acid aminotransferase [Hyphomicrobiales bacterium]|nr:branched-chain amino acid aminotransferase [Hyphomicrobiales bacterium]